MTSVEQALAVAFNRVRSQSSATLTFISGSTPVSASVYKSFLRVYNREMRDANYSDSYDDLFVLANTADIASWNLKPTTDEVQLDGVPYMLGQSITQTSAYTTIWLRIKK